MANHQHYTAAVIEADTDGNWTFAYDTSPAEFTELEENPSPQQYNLNGTFRASWYKYTPVSNCSVTLTVTSPVPYDLKLMDYAGYAFLFMGGAPVTQRPLQAGRTYYIRIAATVDTASAGTLTMTGLGLPAPAVHTASFDVPVLKIGADTRPATVSSTGGDATTPTAGESFELPLMRLGVTVLWPHLDDSTNPPGTIFELPQLRLAVQDLVPVVDGAGGSTPASPATTATIALTSPAQGDVVASAVAHLVVAVDSDDDDDIFIVEVQYAGDAGFSGAVTLRALISVVEGGAVLQPTTAMPTLTFWRARLLGEDGTEILGWSATNSFTVNTNITATVLNVAWTVSSSAGRPIHLWHIDPPGPAIGDTVTIYGQGFPATGHLSFGDTVLDVDTWRLIPATARAGTGERVIAQDTVDCEHYEVTFTAPHYTGPGAALTVEA